MKKTIIILIFAAVFMNLFFVCRADSDMQSFIDRAFKVSEDIKKEDKEYKKAKKRYDKVSKKVDELKRKIKKSGGKAFFFERMELSYYLYKGNKYGYKFYEIKKKISEFKDDYFTFVVLVIEEYDKKIKECIKNKCRDLKNIYFKREKWMERINNYKGISNIHIAFSSGIKRKDEAEDFVKYLKKQSIRLEQCIYIFEEEKQFQSTVKAAGINIDKQDVLVIDEKIEKLKLKLEKVNKDISQIKI